MLSQLSLKELKAFVIKWNNQFPIDRWFRQKYNISFGSEEHRKVNLLDMLIEYEEDSLFRIIPEKLRREREKQKEYEETGEWLSKSSSFQEDYSEEEIDKLFNQIDINELNKNVLKKTDG